MPVISPGKKRTTRGLDYSISEAAQNFQIQLAAALMASIYYPMFQLAIAYFTLRIKRSSRTPLTKNQVLFTLAAR
jgi:hypothetical protein